VRCVLQRVSRARVTVAGEVVGEIGLGLAVLVGVAAGDTQADIEYTASKIRDVRIFTDPDGRMNRSLADVGGAALLVPQFTLLGDARTGRRPAFDAAEKPEAAADLFDRLCAAVRSAGVPVATGRFRATMSVEIANEGPVTILLDSRKVF